MPEWVKVVFDGIGTQIVGIIIGLLIGGVGGCAIGYKIGNIKQTQKAGDNSTQSQVGNITVINNGGVDNGAK